MEGSSNKKPTKESRVDSSMNDGENLGPLTCKFVDAWGDADYAQKLIFDFSQSGLDVYIVSGYKNVSIPMLVSYHAQYLAQEEKLGCRPTMKYAFLPLSKSAVTRFLSDGVFPATDDPVCLFPAESPLESLRSAIPDEDGLYHLVVCKVIMGRVGLVHPDSGQCRLSSEEYDSGVDDLSCPKKLFVWKCNAQTPIVPTYVFSLKTSPKVNGRVPMSPFPLPFRLIKDDVLAVLPLDSYPKAVDVHNEWAERKIKLDELERRIREIAGKDLMQAVENSFNEQVKEVKPWRLDDVYSYLYEKEYFKEKSLFMDPGERAFYKERWPNTGWPFFDERKSGWPFNCGPIEEWRVHKVSSSDLPFPEDLTDGVSNQFGSKRDG